MNRRDVLLASCAAALGSGLSRAQRPARAPVVGILGSSSAQGWTPLTAAFLRGLAEQGYIEGQGLIAEYRWADGRYEELPAMAAALVERQPSVLVAFTTPAALAAKKATSEIPIVFTTIGNPVDIGLVPSLSRPSGNVTGVTSLNVQIVAKRLELLHELLPTDKDVALLVNPDNPTTQKQVQEMQAAAGALGWQPHILNASKAGTSKQPLRALHNCVRRASSSEATSSSPATAINSPRWRCNMGSPPFTRAAPSQRPAE